MAPLAGRAADRGLIRPATGLCFVLAAVSFAAAAWAGQAGALVVLAGTAVLLDVAVQANGVVGQRAIFGLPAAMRGRVNAIYLTTVFLAGAAGSALAPVTLVHGGWGVTCGLGALLGLAGLGLFAMEGRRG